MAVQPLNKTKIIKKQKNHPNRFASDKYKRVGVSHSFSHSELAFYRNPGELPTVLILESVVSSEATRPSPPLVMALIRRPATSCLMDSESCSSAMRRTSTFCSWTTEPTAERFPPPSQPRPGKNSFFRSLLFLCCVDPYRVPLCLCRKAIVQRAKELNVRLTNGTAKLKKQSNEWARGPPTQLSCYRPLQMLFLGSRVAVL